MTNKSESMNISSPSMYICSFLKHFDTNSGKAQQLTI